jgi:signal transduction histidine kinase
MFRKSKSIRSIIITSLVVPVVALSGMWVLGMRDSVSDALALRSAHTTRDQVGRPSALMAEAMQAERSRSQEFLATRRQDGSALRTQRATTDAAVAEFRRLSARYDAGGPGAEITRARIADMIDSLDTLARLRAQIDAGSLDRAVALTQYSTLIGAAFSVLTAASYFGDLQVERVMRTVLDISRAGELFSQEDALVTGAATEGTFGNGEYLQLIQIVGALRFQVPAAGSVLPEDVQSAYSDMLNSPAFTALRAAEDQIIRDGRARGPVPITLAVWKVTFDPAARLLRDFLSRGYDQAIAYARTAGDTVLVRFGVAGGTGLLTIVVSLYLSRRVGRSVVRRLSALRAAATDLAGRQLPDVVARLRAGEHIDVDEEAVSPPSGQDEIAEVGVALAEVRRRAIESAVGEAALRQGMSTVLVNIARRSQGLIGRQLEALGQIRAPEDGRPLVLAEQLAIRMRRDAEHLVIVAGSARGRGGLQPVPLAQILGSAADEVQDADRIEVPSIAEVSLPGRLAADLVHLLAELMENAIAFSPPDTPVRVTSQRVPHGLVVEIEDRGLGMSAATLEKTNSRLSRPRDFDPADSARLGLFVVAVLAAQRGIRVTLQPSTFGGITAVVVIPPDLVDEPGRTGRGWFGRPQSGPPQLEMAKATDGKR